MATKIWKNHNGDVVPAAYVPKLDKEKERTAIAIHKQATDISKRLAEFKAKALKKCDAIFDQMMADNNVTTGKKGNYSITSFDKEIKIEVNVSERIEFDDQIKIAQIKINEYLAEKTEGLDADIVQIINQAFKTRKGQMDTKSVLGLFQLKISHKKWNEAMELIKQSISRNTSKRYMRIWKKDSSGEYKAVELNFSSI
ncbi:MAG: DUF3164 family protein [Bacteroidales bacterium]